MLVLVLFNECFFMGRGDSDIELPSPKEWLYMHFYRKMILRPLLVPKEVYLVAISNQVV